MKLEDVKKMLRDRRFNDVDTAMSSLQPETMPINQGLAWVMVTFYARDYLPSREKFRLKFAKRLIATEVEFEDGRD